MNINILEALCGINAPSENEKELRDYIITQVKPYCDKMFLSSSGSLICYKKGKLPTGKRIIFSAHMDEIGFMIRHISEDGRLFFSPVGGVDPLVVAGRRVLVGDRSVRGVVCSKAVHMQSPEERKKIIPIDEMFIDIGCGTREEALELVSIGDYAVFPPNFERMGTNRIKSKAIDDRFGCACLISLLTDEQEHDIYCVFTVGEETGLIGAKTVLGFFEDTGLKNEFSSLEFCTFAVQRDCNSEKSKSAQSLRVSKKENNYKHEYPEGTVFVVVEATTASDLPGVSETDRACALGEGAVLSHTDGGTLYDRHLLRYVQRAAEQNNIKYQLKTRVAGGNEAYGYQRSGTASLVLAVSLPTRYLHSAGAIADISDMDQTLRLLEILPRTLQDFDQKEDK